MKRRLRLLFTAPFLLALAGACAAPSQSANKSSSPDERQPIAVVTISGNAVPPQPGDELVCEYEEPLGSHIARRICRSKSEVEKLRDETQQAKRNLRDTPPPPNNPASILAPGK